MSVDDVADVTVTIKYRDGSGKGFDEPWAVFRGPLQEVRQNIVAFFGVSDEPTFTLHDVVVNAKRIAHGVEAVASGLGGKVIPLPSREERVQSTDAWSQAAPQKPQEPISGPQEADPEGEDHELLIEALKGADSINTLRRIWAENTEAFKDPAVQDAYKARGKELS